MSCLEKQHVRQKTRMLHPSNLDSFMDETDREVMNLTNRAFKSLCVGDEAVYNDSELLLSPVDNHKPQPKNTSKKSHEKSTLDFRKQEAPRPNGVFITPWQTKNTSKVPSLFAAFTGSNQTEMTNGESWDKSALLSIQTELSEFSLECQNRLMKEHTDKVKSHQKPSEKGKNKLTQDIHNSSGKPSKNHHGKTAKLRKLNSINFFLHSEFSPFQSWEDLNRFGLETMEMFPCSSPGGFYDSPVYTELSNSDRLNIPELNKSQTSQSTSPLEPRHNSKPNVSPCTAHNRKTVPQTPDSHSDINCLQLPDIHVKTIQPKMSSGSFQRSQSEGDICAPWRKSRSKSKGVVQPFICSPACERANNLEQGAIQHKKEVTTVEKGTRLNETPFNISQLLTPIIPPRQETETSEILQSVQTPRAFNNQALHETEIHLSPEFKREDYKSRASSLLFNLKDNRKRVKATYSPPKFKGVDAGDQAKLSPLIEQDVTQHVTDRLEIANSKNTSTDHKTSTSPKTTAIQSPQTSGHINSTLPDDFLGLSLLLSENKGLKKNPLAKATYPSLNMYPKSSSGTLNTKTMSAEAPVLHPTPNKSLEQNISKEHWPEKNSKDLQKKHHQTEPERHYANQEYSHQNQADPADEISAEETNVVDVKVLNKLNAQQNVSSKNQGTLKAGGIFTSEEGPIKCHRKGTQPKHLFSARQNNFIKNQRYVNIDHGNDEECEYWQEDVISAVTDEWRTNDVHKYNGKVQEATRDAFINQNYSHNLKRDQGLRTEQGVMMKNDASAMKGNTSAKIALFTLKEKPSNSSTGSMKKNIVKDKYELATVALEKRIAEREQRKKHCDRQPGLDLSIKREHSQASMLTLGQRDTAENVIAGSQDFKAISEMVQSMSCIDTNHSNEIKQDEPFKRECKSPNTPDRHGQNTVTGNEQPMQNATQLEETGCLPEHTSLGQERLEVSEDTGINEQQRKEDVGHVLSLMEKADREKDQECVNQEENLVYLANDSFNDNSVSSNNITSFPKEEDTLTNQKQEARDLDFDEELPKKESTFDEGNKENLENINKCVTRNVQDTKYVTRNENENASDVLLKTDNPTTFKCHGVSFAKKSLTDNFRKSDEPGPDANVPTDRITLFDIPNTVEPPLLPCDMQSEQDTRYSKLSADCPFTDTAGKTPPLNSVLEKMFEDLDTNNSDAHYNPESHLHPSGLAVHTPKDVEKGGWVRCLLESARSLSPTCHSNVSSPTLGKPALFKVKDNTFRESPVTKTVKPVLHKSVAGVTQPWSPRESLSGSERGEDPEISKDAVGVQSPPLQITQPDRSSLQVVHPPSSQSIRYVDKEGLADSSTMPEEEKWQLAICSVSEGLASCDMSVRETVEDHAFNPECPESIQESQAPSERSDSAFSGLENQLQGKPPAVPPKTEKAMRRAMKLTTKRIQKEEAKSKTDRGRSSEKGSCHKRERRHHSSDKIFSDRLYTQNPSIGRGSNDQSTEEDNSEASLQKIHTSERKARQYNKPNCLRKQDSCHCSLISVAEDAKCDVTEKQSKTQSPHEDQFDTHNIDDRQRLGRSRKKYPPQMLNRRAHSLDRCSSSKYEHSSLSFNDPVSKSNSETLKKLSAAQTAPLRQNSSEHTYRPAANNMAPQSFPMTQRKLLQDLDSGQYFVVDMPVQVKTKTFFDPETGRYVQLPVQSIEGSVPRAQSVEVVNPPPLMLYHGFVPVPVPSLP